MTEEQVNTSDKDKNTTKKDYFRFSTSLKPDDEYVEKFKTIQKQLSGTLIDNNKDPKKLGQETLKYLIDLHYQTNALDHIDLVKLRKELLSIQTDVVSIKKDFLPSTHMPETQKLMEFIEKGDHNGD